MSYNWNKLNGYILRNSVVIVEPDANLLGNVTRIDPVNGIEDFGVQSSGVLVVGYYYEITDNTGVDFTGVGAADNIVGTKFFATGTTPTWGTGELTILNKTGINEIGSRNYAFKTYALAFSQYSITHNNTNYIFASGSEIITLMSYTYSLPSQIHGDGDFTFNLTGNGVNDLLEDEYTEIYDVNLPSHRDLFKSYGGSRNYTIKHCNITSKVASPGISSTTSYFNLFACVVQADMHLSGQDSIEASVVSNVNFELSSANCTASSLLILNADSIFISESQAYNNIFWEGTITIGSNTYDLSAAIAALKSEATIISEMNTLFSSSFTISNIGILTIPFVNVSKANFTLDISNSDTDIILTRLTDLGATDFGAIKRGVKCEYDATEGDSDYINSATSIHYSADDGFSGLKCENINADGSVDVSSYDSIWMTKIFTLSEAVSLDGFLQTGQLDGLDIDFDECYFRGVSQSGQSVEDYYNTTEGFTASYAAGVFTCDLPKYVMNWDANCNKASDSAFGLIEKGSNDLDGVSVEFLTGVIEFQLIFVKRGA